ncbi:cyclic nucleotide-binding domain-containing protein [Aquisalimonas sp.]|uniref:cyclic nucleotide-binding domain-containing protein n=1 Tax=Aquisalimonas sp. TaxID=1872621 RepID=UPI0025BA9E79|nr:cyclic nucleotide-binding domain-containing protein [Aquisalimonas sp.]
MKQGIALLEQLTDADAEWLLASAAEQDVAHGDTLIEAGEPLDSLYLIVQGLFGVFTDDVDVQLATLGPGDLAGEMSYLAAGPPTERVRALENSITFAVPHSALQARADQDPDFSARLHRAFARLLAERLKAANRRSRVATDTDLTTREEAGAWKRLDEPLQAFKRAAFAAKKAAAENGDVVPEAMSAEIVEQFLQFCPLLDQVLSQEVDNERVRGEMGLRMQQELLPYILLAETAERFYSKPRGYAGDFWTIELIYRNRPEGSGAVGRLIDRCFLETTASRAVRNRRDLLAEEIGETVRTRQGSTAQVTSLACGPARELFDVYAAHPEYATDLRATLLDIDLQALAFVDDAAQANGLKRQMSLVSENLIRLALGKARAEIQDQDLVYSIGLIDYLGDDLVVRLMNLIHSMLRPGGRVILGNIHPCNPTRGLMDHVLDWKLVHRTEDDVNRLYAHSAFGRPSTNIRFENEGINLFAECIR